jgi:hypothetical protein
MSPSVSRHSWLAQEQLFRLKSLSLCRRELRSRVLIHPESALVLRSMARRRGSCSTLELELTGNPVSLTVVQDLVAEHGNDKRLSVGTAVVANFPPMFQAVQIGGLLNPQLLARGGEAVVLDMRVPELRIESFDQAVHRLGAKVLAQEELEICISAAAIPNLVFAVAVGVGDRVTRAFAEVGLEVERDPVGLIGRGMYIGRFGTKR